MILEYWQVSVILFQLQLNLLHRSEEAIGSEYYFSDGADVANGNGSPVERGRLLEEMLSAIICLEEALDVGDVSLTGSCNLTDRAGGKSLHQEELSDELAEFKLADKPPLGLLEVFLSCLDVARGGIRLVAWVIVRWDVLQDLVRLEDHMLLGQSDHMKVGLLLVFRSDGLRRPRFTDGIQVLTRT